MIAFHPLDRADPQAIDALLDEAFGPERRMRTAYRIRAGMAPLPDLSLAAFDGDALAGVLLCWPCALVREGEATPLILVGPVAVADDRHGQGIGSAMMRRMLAAATAEPLVLIGDPEYYGRFGFEAAPAAGWAAPGPVEQRRLLVRSDRPLPADGMLAPRA